MAEFLNKLLEKYKLQENIEWQVDGKKESIIDKFKTLTSENYYSSLFWPMDLTAPGDKKYIGTITDKGLTIRNRIKPLVVIPVLAKVNAKFVQLDGQTKVEAKVNGMRIRLLVICLLILTILSLSAFLVVFEALIPPIGEVNPFPDLIFLTINGAIFVLIPFFWARRNVRVMKTELNGILSGEKTTYNNG